jgi:hypothetical protein
MLINVQPLSRPATQRKTGSYARRLATEAAAVAVAIWAVMRWQPCRAFAGRMTSGADGAVVEALVAAMRDSRAVAAVVVAAGDDDDDGDGDAADVRTLDGAAAVGAAMMTVVGAGAAYAAAQMTWLIARPTMMQLPKEMLETTVAAKTKALIEAT